MVLDVLWETVSFPWERRDRGRVLESWLRWTVPERLGTGTWLALGRDGELSALGHWDPAKGLLHLLPDPCHSHPVAQGPLVPFLLLWRRGHGYSRAVPAQVKVTGPLGCVTRDPPINQAVPLL